MHRNNPSSTGSKLIQTGQFNFRPFFLCLFIFIKVRLSDWARLGRGLQKNLNFLSLQVLTVHWNHFELPWNAVHFRCSSVWVRPPAPLCKVTQIGLVQEELLPFWLPFLYGFKVFRFPLWWKRGTYFLLSSVPWKLRMCLAACLIEQTSNLLNNYINIYSNNIDDFSTELVTFSYILCYFVNAWDGT